MRVILGLGSGVKYCVHSGNVKNLAQGIVERVLCVRGSDGELKSAPKPVGKPFDRLQTLRRKLVSGLSSTTVVPRWSYPSLYVGRKRMIYQKAVESLSRRGVDAMDAIVNTFVKAEKVIFKAAGMVPRVIQPRTARYNVEVGRYLKLFEKELIRGFERTFGYCVILKGLNATGVAARLFESWSEFREPVAVGLDASRFDQHVSVEALQFEHSIYNDVFQSPELAKLLEMQLHNRGRAYIDGLKVSYEVDGCRMSGDMNTSMGNCAIMSLIVLGYCDAKNITARLANNGDDCVLVLSKSSLPELAGLDAWFLEFGFTLTREEPVYVFEEIEFCQTKPVWTESGYRMTRNPHSAPSKDMVSLQSWQSATDVDLWRSAIGQCGLELTRGVPFWQSFYSKIDAGVSNANVDERVRESGLGFMARGVVGCAISDASRISFWRAFGMTPDVQLSLEAENWQINSATPDHVMFADIELDKHNSLSKWSIATT